MDDMVPHRTALRWVAWSLLSSTSPMLPRRDVVDSGTMPAEDSSSCV
jgi:hypothetical protein